MKKLHQKDTKSESVRQYMIAKLKKRCNLPLERRDEQLINNVDIQLNLELS